MRLVGGKISCSSCHGMHFTDSDSTTADGLANYNSLAAGDGYILRSDGPERTGASSAETAQLRSNLCQACHTYKTHGSGTEELGCLGCHGGHSYNEGNPNYFVLRDQTSTATYNAVTGLDYTTLPKPYDAGGPDIWTVWADNSVGTNDGYCEKCHGDLETMPGSTRAHTEGENCRTCHEHNGTTATYSFEASGGCTGCHGDPPIENVAGGDPNAGYAVSGGNDYSTSGVFKDESLTPHKTHANGSSDYSFSCEECHANNSHDTGTFQDVLIAPTTSLADGSGNLVPAYDGAGSGTCSAVYCHSNGGARTGDASRTYTAATIPVWEGGLNGITTCDACHGNTAATMSGLNSDRHQQHVTAYDCNVCHVSTAASSTTLAAGAIGGTHVNEVRDVDFDTGYNLGAAALTEGATPYDGTAGTCAVYCHSDGAGTFKSPDWDTTATGNCTVCHNSDVASGSPMATGSHSSHIDDSDSEIGWDLGCAECHSNTVSDNSTIATPANHIDGGKTLGISRDGNQTTCSNISCHSDGNLDGTLTYKDPTWGTTLSGCDDCHGDGAGNAYPTYANGGAASVDANSHAAHVNSGITCGECHSATSTAGSAIDGATPTSHVNQAIDVAGADIGGWDGGSKTCSTVACHGGNSPVWGDSGLSCADCHLGTGDTDDFTYNNGTTAKVDSAEWGFSGHGLSSASTYEVTGRAGADFDAAASGATASACFYCHDGAVGHGDANLFRLKDNGYGDLNGNCLGCHATGSAGVDPDGGGADYAAENSTAKVDKYHYGAGHTSTTDGGRWCWDCHDPHGDASTNGVRIQMIQRNAGVNPDANGVPASVTTTEVIFSDNTLGAGAGGFARDASPFAEGICNNCHTATAQYTQTGGAGSHSTDKCTTCHEHSADSTYNGEAFKGSGCNSCHGDTVSGQYWPDGSGGSPAYVDDQIGAHDNHITAISQELYSLGISGLLADADTDLKQKEICAFCHADPGGSGHNTDSGDSRVDVYQDSDDGAGNTDVFRKWGPAAQDYASDVDGTVSNQAYDYANANCSNLACHNGTATPSGGNDWITPPATPDCSVCHTGSGSSAGRHDLHVGTEGYACTECHVNNGTYPTDTANLAHAEGTVQLDWTNTGSFEQTYGGSSVTYNGTLIYGDASFGTCATAACHWDVESPAFDAAATGSCTVCHGTPATGKHGEHVANDVLVPGDCVDCHGTSADTGDHTGHISGSLDEVVSYNSVDKTCTNTCHIANTTDDWSNTGVLACADCHDADNVGGKTDGYYSLDQNAYPPVSNTHTPHLDNNVYVPGDCADCHGTSADTGAHANHKDGTTDVDSALGYSSPTCSTASCHNTVVGRDWTTGTLTCTDCHQASSGYIGDNTGAYLPASGLHTVTPSVTGQTHNESVAGGCAACHTSVDGLGTHVDGTFSGDNTTNMGLAAFYTQSAADTGTCSTTSCHSGRDDWSHKWDSSAGAYTTDVTACANCHGDFSSGFAAGTIHRTTAGTVSKHGTGTSYQCKDCHNLEAASGYTYTWSTGDWNPADGTSTHGDGQIQINSNGTSFNETNGTCESCHTNDGTHNFNDTGWTIALASGEGISTTCGECHQGGVAPGSVTESHTKHGISDADLVDGGAACVVCHGDNGGLNYASTLSGSHGDDSVTLDTGRITTYTGGLVKWDGSESTCTNTCHETAGGEVWDVTNSLACDSCHYYEATVSSANNTGSTAVGGSHNAHYNSAVITACTTCHPDNTADTAAPHAHIQGTTLLEKSSEGLLVDNADLSPMGADFDDTNNTCNNAACHNPSNDASVSNAWGTANTGCAMCHSDTDPATGSHTAHMSASGTFGITPACADCHVDNTGNEAHLDGSTVDFAAGMNYSAGAEDVGGTVGTCSTTTCHNDGSGTAVTTPTWGNASATQCATCHNDGASNPEPATGRHGEHMANADLIAGCTDCHTSETATTHIDGAKDLDGAKVTYTAPSCTNSCHNVTDATDGDWLDANPLSCTNCHDADNEAGQPEGTFSLDQNGYPPVSAKHSEHLGNTAYVTGSCADCHGASADTGAHAGHKNAVVDETVSYASVNQTCTNSCHQSDTTGDWSAGGALACRDCHQASSGYIGDNTGAYLPASGLHTVTPSVTGQTHNESVAGGCAACHTSVDGLGTHVDGTFTGDNTTNMGLAAFYTQSAADTGSCSTTSCHSGRDDWTHQWDSTAGAYTTDVTACANCHGDFSSGFAAGTIHRTTAGTVSKHGTGTSYQCKDCHNLEAASGYTYTFDTGDWNPADGTSTHGDGQIQVNSNSTSYNSVNGTCEACHTNDGTYNFNDTGWTIALASGDAITTTCGECHDDGALPPNSGAHLAHGADGDTDYTECIECHGDNGDSYATTSGTHNNGAVDFAAGITYSDGGTAGTNAAADDDTCSTTVCHSGGATVSWSATSLSCSECHYYEATPTSANNTGDSNPLGGNHGAHFDAGSVCTDCHADNSGDTTDPLTHMAGTTLTDRANAAQDEATVTAAALNTGSDPDPGNPSCDNAACHNPSGGAYNATWATSVSSCTLCHSDTDPATGSHTAHMNASGTFGISPVCADCHTDNTGNNAHRDAAVTFAADMNYTAGAEDVGGTMGSCSTTTCHNDGTGAAVATPNWGTASATTCGTCHSGAPATGSHGTHVTAATASYGSTANSSTTTTYDFGCGNCHGSTLGNHLNTTVNVDVGTGWNGTTCSTNACHHDGTGAAPAENPDWVNGFTAGDRCAKCHGNSPATGSHGAHTVGIHYDTIYTGTSGLATAGTTGTSSHGNATTSTTINCNLCHNSTVTTYANDQNATCVTCHDGTTATLQGNAAIADKTFHVNGVKEVAFAAVNIKSKAQVRDDITTVPLYNSVWLRNGGYKAAGAYDSAKASLDTAGFAGGSCSTVACHNNQSVTWGDTGVSCTNCHTTLP